MPDFSQQKDQPPHLVVVIPARYQSTRFPGKPLADIAGRPMIEHVYARAAEVPGVSAVIVATDDDRIAEAVARFGGVARMTRSTHRTGLERVAEVAADLTCDIVVNVQGDEPLLEPRMVTEVACAIEADERVRMSTLRRRIDDPADVSNPNVVKVVVDLQGDALYFSRATVPFVHGTATPTFRHIGLYAYRRAFACELAALPATPLEIAESLEQLRALEHGFSIRVVETQYDSIGVDTPEDLERVRRRMAVETRV
ncbi:MAG: 3-deoxy-manno-octulosonate cytidylyltransferase [Acidobacteria bacterium]|nr:3-deoxy-manno-octulosonate cytidylyltransferase [Acidobacteriota bacterium]